MFSGSLLPIVSRHVLQKVKFQAPYRLPVHSVKAQEILCGLILCGHGYSFSDFLSPSLLLFKIIMHICINFEKTVINRMVCS